MDLYIDTPAALDDLCARLHHSQWLALDTEFIREKTYYPRLCLLQVANDALVACVDPLALADMASLFELLFDSTVTKVLHSAYQDLEIFHNLQGKLPSPVFDTQIAATLVGWGDQVGYAQLVKDLCEIDLDKSQTRTDWSQRPLTPAQLSYAADDVRYLRDIYQRQHADLVSQQRLAWLKDDFAALCDPAQYQVQPQAAWRRIKGSRNLRGVQLAVLQALAAWREQRAIEADLPRKWVLSDKLLLDLARTMPTTQKHLARIQSLDARTRRRYGEIITTLIETARQQPHESWPILLPRLQLSAEQDALVDAAMAVLRLRGAQQAVDPSMLATRKDLERLILGAQNIPLLRGWRAVIAGREVQNLLAGKLCLEVRDGELSTAVSAASE